jgi:hypothetical protein
MKALLLTQHDWANTGWRFSECLKMLGIDVTMYKGNLHALGYPKQAEIKTCLREAKVGDYNGSPVIYIKAHNLREEAEKADVLHFFTSTFVDTGVSLTDKKVVVQHGGSVYRMNPSMSAFFNSITDATIIQCPDLLGLGSKNEHLIYYPVQLDILHPTYKRKKDKLLIGHWPSNPVTKGTENVLRVLERLSKNPKTGNKFEYIGTHEAVKKRQVPWLEHLKRVRSCDILIETCNPEQRGKKYGEWGNAAIEAAALGKIVVTNSLAKDIYKEEYGDCALHIANDPNELYEELSKILRMSNEEILADKKKTYQWVKEKHSMGATAQRVWDKVYKYF